MSFISKLWKDRVSDYPNKRKLTKEDGTSETVTVERAEGDIVVAGDAFNAENMNDLETRIQNGFNAVEQAQAELNKKLEVDKIIMDTVLVTFVNGVGTVTYDGKGYSKAICVANFMADAAYPSGYHNQLGVIAANGKINFYTHSTSNGKTYVAYILGLKK